MSSNSRWFLDTQHWFSFKEEHENSCCSLKLLYIYLYIQSVYLLFRKYCSVPASETESSKWGNVTRALLWPGWLLWGRQGAKINDVLLLLSQAVRGRWERRRGRQSNRKKTVCKVWRHYNEKHIIKIFYNFSL